MTLINIHPPPPKEYQNALPILLPTYIDRNLSTKQLKEPTSEFIIYIHLTNSTPTPR